MCARACVQSVAAKRLTATQLRDFQPQWLWKIFGRGGRESIFKFHRLHFPISFSATTTVVNKLISRKMGYFWVKQFSIAIKRIFLSSQWALCRDRNSISAKAFFTVTEKHMTECPSPKEAHVWMSIGIETLINFDNGQTEGKNVKQTTKIPRN